MKGLDLLPWGRDLTHERRRCVFPCCLGRLWESPGLIHIDFQAAPVQSRSDVWAGSGAAIALGPEACVVYEGADLEAGETGFPLDTKGSSFRK